MADDDQDDQVRSHPSSNRNQSRKFKKKVNKRRSCNRSFSDTSVSHISPESFSSKNKKINQKDKFQDKNKDSSDHTSDVEPNTSTRRIKRANHNRKVSSNSNKSDTPGDLKFGLGQEESFTLQDKPRKSESCTSPTGRNTESKVTKVRSDSEILSRKQRKRKRKEVLFYSPKRLRSSTESSNQDKQSAHLFAKTGSRNSRLRNPSGGSGSTNISSSSTVGSGASSRRHRRWRSRGEPPAMENEGSRNIDNPESTETNEEDQSSSGPTVGAVASLGTSGSASSQDGDIELGLEEGDMSRLQALLEARGLPAHLFGSLGPRMHLLLHKTFNSGTGSKAQQLVTSMQSEDEGTQLQGAMEMCQLLVMGNEETLAGFPVKQVVPILVTLLQMEHNFDIMNHACRALTYLMEALPRSSNVVVDAIPVLLEKLQTIQCMDVAEQSLTALEMLSKRHGKSVLQAGGLGASLLFLDFFSILAQRSALAITANCCHSITSEDFSFVKDSIQTLTNRLNNQDKKSLESVCTAFARLVDNVQKDEHLLEALCEFGLLANLKQLLVISPSIISSNIFVMVIRMLAIMCASCPSIAVKLMKLNIAETLRYLLIGSNDIPSDEIIELIPRSPQELYELTCLISELLPKLPVTGIFVVDTYLNKNVNGNNQQCTWQWRDDRSSWHSYLWVDNRIIEAAYQSGEDEISLQTQGRNYIIDFANMQQINEDTGTVRAIQRKSGTVGHQFTVINKTSDTDKNEKDKRTIIFDKEPELGQNLVQSLIGVVYNVYFSSVGPAVKHKCLHSMLKMLHFGPAELLKDVLLKIPISSYIASMLYSSDLRIVCSSLQKADILMKKLSKTFHVFFRREGVMHKIKHLAEGNLNCSPSVTPKTNNSPSERKKENYLRGSSSETAVKKASSNSDIGHLYDDIAMRDNTADMEKPSCSTRLSSLRSKKQSVKKLSRKRNSKNDLLGEASTSSVTNQSKKLSHETTARPKSASLSSTSYTPGNTSKGSFFSNFAPRWGRSQSCQSTTSSLTNNSSNKTFKERYAKEQEKNKENIKEWIKKTAKQLYERYFADDSGDGHPALEILKKLTTSSKELTLKDGSDLEALQRLYKVVLNEGNNADASPFEIVHSGMVSALLKFLTAEAEKNEILQKTRIKRFINIFLGIKSSTDIINGKAIANEKALRSLILKLNLCINQLEQFPVKCHDIPGANLTTGSRGSSALRFFNTHQIKCNLQRHPDCNSVKQWSGGAVKIDPLALVQAIERYLIVRGFGKVKESGFSLDKFLDDMSEEEEEHSDIDGEELLVSLLQSSNNSKHVLEFVLNGRILPYNMTVYQAVQQYGNPNTNTDDGMDDGSDAEPFNSSAVWSTTHTLYYRPVSTLSEKSSSLTSVSSTSSSTKRTKSSPSNASTSKSFLKNIISEQPKSSDSSTMLSPRIDIECCSLDPSIDVICLMRVLYYLNCNWGKYVGSKSSGPVISPLEFINSKLTAKATRQLQDPLVIMTGNLPTWLPELAKACPFIFPFECRQLLFYTSTFDRDRAVMKLQETIPDLSSADSNDRVTPRLDKKKRVVSRCDLFKQAEGVINEFVNLKSLLEIQYEGEVGTGLGPTLEFYALVSKEFQKEEYELWRSDATIEVEDDNQQKLKYLFAKTGLFPAAMPKNSKYSHLNRMKNRFKFLGKFIAKALMDSRMIDIPFSETFYKLMLNHETNIDIIDMINVDESLYKSLQQLHEIVIQKQTIINDKSHSIDSLQLAINSLTLNGTPIEDLGLDFVLPGTNIELKKGGKDIIVTIENLDEYLKLVVQYSLVDGVSRQMQSFKDGFEQFFPLSSLKMFYPAEMDLLLCGSKSQQWQVKDLMECCRPDHGYTSDSRAVKFLFEILCKYNAEEQRMFLQFITGSPRLPVGGFKNLNPALKIVRKTVDNDSNPDDYLPSVMTCVNYLKLPDYSSIKIMSEKLRTAYNEGRNAFHLS